MRSLDEYIQKAAKNGGTRSGMILGIRMALLGLTQLGIEDPAALHRELIVFVETERCLPDAIELVTKCRLGNRTLKLRDIGKMAASFVDRTGHGIRIAARESANAQALTTFPDREREEALARAYRAFSEDELFRCQPVRVNMAPQEIPGYNASRVMCTACGEGVAFGREILDGQRILCRSCVGLSYFQAL